MNLAIYGGDNSALQYSRYFGAVDSATRIMTSTMTTTTTDTVTSAITATTTVTATSTTTATTNPILAHANGSSGPSYSGYLPTIALLSAMVVVVTVTVMAVARRFKH